VYHTPCLVQLRGFRIYIDVESAAAAERQLLEKEVLPRTPMTQGRPMVSSKPRSRAHCRGRCAGALAIKHVNVLVHYAVATLSDASDEELVTQRAELRARLEGVEAQLCLLPNP